MTAKFRRALAFVLKNEGLDSNHPADRGGHTRWGITAATAKKHGFRIRELTPDRAALIYSREYWQYEWICDERLAIKVFDLAVNMGNHAANKLLQSAVNDCGYAIAIDGIVGPKTRLAVALLDPERLLHELIEKAKDRYADIIAANPTQKVFEKGWMARADRLPEPKTDV